jgi:hypothetical protein
MLDTVLAALGTLIGPLADLGNRRHDRRQQAIHDVSKALTETQLYITQVAEHRGENRPVEEQLVRLWRNAALSIRPFDETLAFTCEHKSEYWLDPANWNPTPEVDHRVQIDVVLNQYRNLALPGFAAETQG